jgi:hypothetical protein
VEAKEYYMSDYKVRCRETIFDTKMWPCVAIFQKKHWTSQPWGILALPQHSYRVSA